jgi:hypothetical protein
MFSSFGQHSAFQKQLFEREIRSSLAKLERLAMLLPPEDQQRQSRALSDLEQLNKQFEEVVMH